MTRQQAADVLRQVADVYPGYYRGKSREELVAVVDLWARVFAADSPEAVLAALEVLYGQCRYPPSPAQVMEQLGRRGAAGRCDMDMLARRCEEMRRKNRNWMVDPRHRG